MNAVWNVYGNSLSRLTMWRSSGGEFWVTVPGEYPTLLCNHNYVLIDNKFKSLFVGLSDQLKIEDVKIVDRKLNTEINTYSELTIFNAIDPKSVKTVDSSGMKIWNFSGNVFVSEELKTALIQIDPTAFEFSLGFSHFAG